MKIDHIKKGALEYIVIDDLYDSNQLKNIKEEIKNLLPKTTTNDTDTALDIKTKELLKDGKSLWVDTLYSSNRDDSAILKNNRIIFDPELNKKLKSFNIHFGHIEMSTYDATLLNYYADGQQYKAHKDASVITTLSFFKLGDFTGGDLVFPEYEEVIPFRENSMVIFPGCLLHKAEPIKTKNKKSYRVSIAQFILYKT
jgi:hypothetical protein